MSNDQPAPMTDIDATRAALEQMVALCKGDYAYRARIGIEWATDYFPHRGDDEENRYLAAASPDLLLRLATEALAVLDRHGVYHDGERIRSCLCGERLPCPEVQAVIRAWTP